MKKLLLFVLLALGVFSAPVRAQQTQTLAFIVTTCGTLATPYIAGKYGIITMDVTGKICDSATGGGGGNTSVQSAVNVTPTDCSITLVAGGTAQNIIAANITLHGFTIANIDSTTGSGEPVWMSFTTTAAASATQSYPLSAPTATTFAGLSSYTTPLGFGTNNAVSVIAATTGHKISCTRW